MFKRLQTIYVTNKWHLYLRDTFASFEYHKLQMPYKFHRRLNVIKLIGLTSNTQRQQ